MSCHDCKRSVMLKKCENHNPTLASICKDCCITKFKGHKCNWFDLCWED